MLDVSRSGFYTHRHHQLGPRRQRDLELLPLIDRIFWEHKRRYGTRRIFAELRARGQRCSRDQVARLMRELDLLAIQPRSFQPRTTDSRHTLGYSPNLMPEVGIPTHVNQVWVGDITYLPMKSGDFLYLAVLMDRWSRRLVGWAIDDHMEESLVLTALRAAIQRRQPHAGLVHHTDRGGQYAGANYRAVLKRSSMNQSMAKADDDYGNVFMESCFGTIKRELELKSFDHQLDAKRQVLPYLDSYYNYQRRHSALAYMTPVEFEQRYGRP